MKMKKINDGYVIKVQGIEEFEVSGDTKKQAMKKAIEALEVDIECCVKSHEDLAQATKLIQDILERL
jgi:hypothetical protein